MIKKVKQFRLALLFIFFALGMVENAPCDNLTVRVKIDDKIFANKTVYVYTEAHGNTGITVETNASGDAVFPLSVFKPGLYQFMIEFMESPIWSRTVELPGTTLFEFNIYKGPVHVAVGNASGLAGNVRVYLYSRNKTDLKEHQVADASGKAAFYLPFGGEFLFKTDILGHSYWSKPCQISQIRSNIFDIDTGGGEFTLTVWKGPGIPFVGATCQLCLENGAYLGKNAITGNNGDATFRLTKGRYKIKIEHLGYTFFSKIYPFSDRLMEDFTIPHKDITAQVSLSFRGVNSLLDGAQVHLFVDKNRYLKIHKVTDINGQVTFNLPENRAYQIRVDYMKQHFWSDFFASKNYAVEIPMGEINVHFSKGEMPVKQARSYAFLSSGASLGYNKYTDGNGTANFRLPAGEKYKIRINYSGEKYWSKEILLKPDERVPFNEKLFLLTVMKEKDVPLKNTKCYLYDQSGNNLLTEKISDKKGQAPFRLKHGKYRFLIESTGNTFWTEEFSVPATYTEEFVVPFHKMNFTVYYTSGNAEYTLKDASVFLHSDTGVDLNQHEFTDDAGQVSFDGLPGHAYKVRVDYGGRSYWSHIFKGDSDHVTIVISEGEQPDMTKGP